MIKYLCILLSFLASSVLAQKSTPITSSILLGSSRGVGHLAKYLDYSPTFGAELTFPYFFQTEVLIQGSYTQWSFEDYNVHHLNGKAGFRYTLLPKLGTAIDLGLEMNMIQGDLPETYLLSDKESEYGWGFGWQVFRYASKQGLLLSTQLRVSQIWTKPETSWFAGLFITGGWAW